MESLNKKEKGAINIFFAQKEMKEKKIFERPVCGMACMHGENVNRLLISFLSFKKKKKIKKSFTMFFCYYCCCCCCNVYYLFFFSWYSLKYSSDHDDDDDDDDDGGKKFLLRVQ